MRTKNMALFISFFLFLVTFMPVMGTTVAYADTTKFVDTNNDGKDDATGLVKAAWDIQYGSASTSGSYNNPSDIKVDIGADGSLNISGGGFNKNKQEAWNDVIRQYKYVITGFAAMGAVSMIVFFIINFLKLGASVGNPQARAQALSGCLWTGIAATGLGAISLIVGFFYSAIGG